MEYLASNVSGNYSVFGVPESLFLWAAISKVIWWFVVVVSTISAFLYMYAGAELILHKQHYKQAVLFAIVCLDGLMLLTMGLGTLLQRYVPHRHLVGAILCKSMAFISNTAAIFSNWCWFLLWGKRYLAVFYPLCQLRNQHQLNWVLPGLLFLSLATESWTIAVTTEYNMGGIAVCRLDTRIANYRVLKWVGLAEVIVSYFLPFILIGLADAMVLCRSYGGSLTQVSRDQLKSRVSIPESVKIMPRNHQKRAQQIRQKALVRTILAASLDMILNLPDYLLQILDNFVSLHDIIGDSRVIHSLEAISYILYYCQYPLIVWYVRVIGQELYAGANAASCRTLISLPTENKQKRSEYNTLSHQRTNFPDRTTKTVKYAGQNCLDAPKKEQSSTNDASENLTGSTFNKQTSI